MAKTKATAKTLEACRKLGWLADVCERKLYARGPGGKPLPNATSKDLFGFADIAVIGEYSGTLYIQATAGHHGKARVRKIVEDCHDNAMRVLQAGNDIEVWDWRQYKKPTKAGGTKERWDAVRWRIRIKRGQLVAEPISSYLELKEFLKQHRARQKERLKHEHVA